MIFPMKHTVIENKKKILLRFVFGYETKVLLPKKKEAIDGKVSKETVVLHRWERRGVLQDYNITWFNQLSC